MLVHLGFLPTELFASIYGPLCRQAWHHAIQDCAWIARKRLKSFLDAVVSRMRLQIPDLWHDAQLGLQKVRGKSFCCMCPWNMQPWAFFPCGHGICERDAWRHSGIQPNDAEHPTLSHFKACPACHAPVDLKIRLRPLQAGYRVATFDGGGVLGIVSLVALRSIIEGLPRALSAHHLFDLIVGTSTGTFSGSCTRNLRSTDGQRNRLNHKRCAWSYAMAAIVLHRDVLLHSKRYIY
jgi:hypothetical protein